MEENSRELFSFWSQLFTGLALDSSHIQMNYETILPGNQLSYHFTGHSSHHGWPSESRRIVGSLHSIRPSGLDLSTGLANRFNWSLPGWNLAEIYGIDVLCCGMWFDGIWFRKKLFFSSNWLLQGLTLVTRLANCLNCWFLARGDILVSAVYYHR